MLREVGSNKQRTTTNYNHHHLQQRMLQSAKTNNDKRERIDDGRERIGRPIGSLARDPTVISSSTTSMSIDAMLSGANNENVENNNTGSKTKKTITYVASTIGAIIALVLLIGLGLFVGRRRRRNRECKQNPLAEQNSDDVIDTSDDDEEEVRRRNEYEENVEVSDSSYDGRYGACSRYSSHTDDTSTIATTTTKPTKITVVVPTADNKTNKSKEERKETQDSSWFGWALGSIAEDKPSGHNDTYGEI